MSRIFLIPGMGADSRIYGHIKTDGYEQVLVDWFEPESDDTIAAYAQKIKQHYQIADGDLVIGNSLGGMMAVEIAKTTRLKKTILISSIKTVGEAPWYYPLFRALPVYKLIPDWLLLRTGKFARAVLGEMKKADSLLLSNMLRNSSARFLKWSMRAALYWDNRVVPPNTYHITGDNDQIFDYRRIKDVTIVPGGTHVMIYNRAAEVNEWLSIVLAK